MECNKDEALRAKEISERKMENKDFAGARRLLLRAQQLYPALENVSQMLTVCEIHNSAEEKISGSGMNWYSILQVEQTADEISIKKQYRKFALLLHPDKNKFPGAEAAFKLIGEAHRILSDRMQRSGYDMKLTSMRTAMPKQPAMPPRKKPLSKQPAVQTASANAADQPFTKSRLNQQQQQQSGPSTKQPGVQGTVDSANPLFTRSRPQQQQQQKDQSIPCGTRAGTLRGVQSTPVTDAKPLFTTSTLYPQQQQQQQQPRSGVHIGRQTFRTRCPFCSMEHEYYNDSVSKVLRCQECQQPFIATVDSHGGCQQPKLNQFRFSQQKVFPVQADPKVAPQNTSVNSFHNTGFQRNCNRAATAAELFPNNSNVGLGSQTNRKEDGSGDMGVRKKTEKLAKFTTENSRERKPSERTNKKRGRNESSTGNDAGSGSGEVIKENGGPRVGQSTGFTGQLFPRRSPRKRQDATDNEGVGNSDWFTNPLKRARTGSSNVAEEQSTKESSEVEALKTHKPQSCTSVSEADKDKEDCEAYKKPQGFTSNKQEGSVHRDRSSPYGNDGAEIPSVNNNSKPNKGPQIEPEPEFHEYPDTDFNDFEKERAEDRFAVDQIWAIYDTLDGMPRFYARIRKLCNPGFKLRITWLEADSDKQDEIDWYNEDLPVACGKFKLGDTQISEDRLMFSHLISWEKGTGRGSYMIFPRKGETWALFKNWDIGWKSDPDNHRQYDFEYVEVLSDYTEKQGITVAYLVKLEGFVSLFKQTSEKRVVPTNELLRFSHMIPSVRMTGKERDDVPEGSFELDPGSFPVNLAVPSEEVYHKEKGELLKESVRPSTPKISRNLDEKISQEVEILKCVNRFPAESNGNHGKKLPSQTTASQCSVEEEISKHSDCLKENSHGGLNPEEASPFQDDVKKSHMDSFVDHLHPSPASCPSASFPDPVEIPETIFYNFDANRSEKKFQPGQVWALYSDEDGFPKYYARISKVESSPKFKVRVTWLEACRTPENMLQWLQKDVPVSCGVFRLATSSGSMAYTDVSPFSHQVKTETLARNRNKYEIYPRKGEIWALYKNFDVNWTCSELANCDYDMVEVLEDDQSAIRVLVLKQEDGFKTIFRAQVIGGSKNTVTIPRDELLRFSHQIPAFQLADERDGILKGCWELDPASFPVN